jgi:hypothetical protein
MWPNTWTCKAVRWWDFERWTSHALYSICFRLCVWAIRCCSHLAQPCVLFHRWVGKTCDTLFDQSNDEPLESGDMFGVVMSIRVEKCYRSWDIRSESYLPTRVGHMARVTHMTGVASSNRSWAYDWSRVFWPESRLSTGVGHTTEVVSSNWSQAYDRGRVFRPESGIQPESRIRLETYLSTRVVRYLHYNHV